MSSFPSPEVATAHPTTPLVSHRLRALCGLSLLMLTGTTACEGCGGSAGVASPPNPAEAGGNGGDANDDNGGDANDDNGGDANDDNGGDANDNNGGDANEGNGSAGTRAGTGGAPGQAAPGRAGGSGEEMPAASVFGEDQVIEYRVTIDPADWQELEEHGDAEVYWAVELEVRGSEVGNQALGPVGIRHKGSWTLHHCWDEFDGVRSHDAECAKLSYKLSFNEYQADTRFEGLKRLNLHASSGEATKLREMLAYSTFHDFGVKTSRTAPAKLFINDEFQGLFIAVEEIDGRFTDFHFPDGGNGNLYKEVWPRAGLTDQHFLDALRTNEEGADVSDMQGFSAAVGATSEQTFLSDMEPWVDVDSLLRYVAVDRASKNWDGIMAFYSPERPHNFYWYHDDGTEGRFHLIPWDLDNTFWEFDPFAAPEQWATADPVPDWNELPASCDPMPVWEPTSDTRVTPPGCDPLLRLLARTQWDRFVSIGQELLDGPLRYETMLAKVTHWASIIEPIIAEDPYVSADEWREQKDQFPSVLERDIADFRALLQAGYTVEEPEPALPEPSQEELDAPRPEHGLLLDQVNNFEFTDAVADDPPAGVYWYGADGVTGVPVYNMTDPVSGTADLRFDYDFTRVDGAYNEWVDVVVPTEGGQEVDISGYTQISMTLRSNTTRTVRVRISSPAYGDEFGGAWAEFGTEFSVAPTPTTFKMRFERLYYPDWAKDDWEGTDKGWGTSDEEALLVLLGRFDGLLFAPRATTTADGELASETESGYLQIDNIYFQ